MRVAAQIGEKYSMFGTIVNALVVLVGGVVGNFVKQGFPERIKNTIMQGLALAVMLIGISMALKTENVMIIIGSLVVGGIVGELLDIELQLNRVGAWLESKFGGQQGEFGHGFVTASLVYCVGAMAIMGSLQGGLEGKHDILLAKSMLDGISSVVFASTMGLGVAFAALPILLYQGSITLLASWIAALLTATIITEMSAAGGLLILGLGFNMLGMAKIKVGNLLPSIFAPIVIIYAQQLVSALR